jgi:hypothetical protein
MIPSPITWVDRSLVAVDGFHHVLEDRIQELAGLFGIPVGEQLHRALEVGEQYRDLFALAFEGGLRGQDLLGEVLGSVAIGRREAEGCERRSRTDDKRRSATIAELASGLCLGATVGTDGTKGRAALPAESGPVAVLDLAARTRHRGRPPDWRSRGGFQRGMSGPSLAGGSLRVKDCQSGVE